MPGLIGALFIGQSGMVAYSQGLRTISDNVANLNTLGYRAQQVAFADSFSFGSSAYDRSTVQNNVGQGVTYSDGAIDFRTGELRDTGNDLDLALDGNGFLTFLNGTRTLLGRTGQFELNDDGFVVDSLTGFRLAFLNGAGVPQAVTLAQSRTSAPIATSQVALSDILSSSATSATVSNVKVYDSTGFVHVLSIEFTKGGSTTAPGTWTITVKNAAGDSVFTKDVQFFGASVQASDEVFEVSFEPEGGEAISFDLDISEIDYFSAGTTSTVRVSESDGRAAGTLQTLAIDEEGRLQLTYSNGEESTLGHVAIATVSDQTRLQRQGDRLFSYTGRGSIDFGKSGVNGRGTLSSGKVEASNVDLASEFSDLILIQRGFQASSQVISASNEMLQQLLSMRSQG